MPFVEFIGKDLYFLAAVGAIAKEGFKILQLFKAGTMLWGGHNAASCILHKNAYRFMGDEEKVAGEYTHVEKRPQAYDNSHHIGEGKIGTANIARRLLEIHVHDYPDLPLYPEALLQKYLATKVREGLDQK